MGPTPTLYVVFNLLCAAVADRALTEKGRAELQRLREFAGHTRYGECWTRALDGVEANCRDLTEDTQSRMALGFTHCHLSRSGRSFPKCPEGSTIEACTRDMDPVAFNTYTEFFTHSHSICHYLQNEQWQHRAETTIHRLTESSADVAEQLESTQKIAENLVKAQSAAMKSQETILRNGEEMKTTLQHSTEGLKDVFAEMRQSAKDHQLAFAEIFNRITYLQSFIMAESHTFSSFLYNGLAFCVSILLTCTSYTSGARFFLLLLVFLNVYLENLICNKILESSEEEYQQRERIAFWVGGLRTVMVIIAITILAYFILGYRNMSRKSLEILKELKETNLQIQETLKSAQCFIGSLNTWTDPSQKSLSVKCGQGEERSLVILHPSDAVESTSLHRSKGQLHEGFISQMETPNSSKIMKKPRRSSSGSQSRKTMSLVNHVKVENDHVQERYSLRSRGSPCAHVPRV